MVDYNHILRRAAHHHASEESALEKARNMHARDISTVSDDRWLATMAKCVFNAGFNWKVIDAKWPGFEAAFAGFDPGKLAFFGDDMLDQLLSDPRIVRNGQKIKATLENAKFVNETARDHGSFGAFVAGWSADDQLGLMTYLATHGARLGGATAQYTLRFAGWDAWITSTDVCWALVHEGVLEKPEAKTKAALDRVQRAINDLHIQSGQPRAVISRLLSLSVG